MRRSYSWLILPVLVVVVPGRAGRGGAWTRRRSPCSACSPRSAPRCDSARRRDGRARDGVLPARPGPGGSSAPGSASCSGAPRCSARRCSPAGIGPWLPFQMLGPAWVGLGAGLLPGRVSRVGGEITMSLGEAGQSPALTRNRRSSSRWRRAGAPAADVFRRHAVVESSGSATTCAFPLCSGKEHIMRGRTRTSRIAAYVASGALVVSGTVLAATPAEAAPHDPVGINEGATWVGKES